MSVSHSPIVPLAPRTRFYTRVRRSALVSSGLVSVSLAVGTVGYHALQPIGWMASFHKASMILSGMGPVEPFMEGTAGKLFESLYALYSGVVLLASTAILFAPIVHRLLHRFHLQDSRE